MDLLVIASRMKTGKERHAAREPRVGHTWPSALLENIVSNETDYENMLFLFENQESIQPTPAQSFDKLVFKRSTEVRMTQKPTPKYLT